MSDEEESDTFQKIKNYVKRLIADIDAKEVLSLLIFAIIIFFIFKLMFGGIFGISLVVIENGPCPASSMCPTYDKGDMFVISKSSPEKIEMGDVIVYASASSYDPGRLIIHRVINITIIETASGPDYYFRVSGDNYDTNDNIDHYNTSNTLIPYDAVKGKTIMVIRKIGYLRLWLSDNPFIRNILLVLVVGVGAYLILAPEKKTEEEKEEEEKEKAAKKEKREAQKNKEFKVRVKEFLHNSWKSTKKWFVELITVKKRRIYLIVITSIIILMVILIPVIDQSIRVEGVTTGIHGISSLHLDDLTYASEGIIFLSYNIHYSDDGSWNEVFRCFLVEGIQNNTVIGTFKWKALYQPEIDAIIGGSMIFDIAEFNASMSLTLKITYNIIHRFGPDQIGLVYQDTFTALDW